MTDKKYVFEFDPLHGVGLSDAQVPGYIDMIISAALCCEKQSHFVLGNELSIDWIRYSILQGKLPHKECAFKFNNEFFEINDYGYIVNCPSAFNHQLDVITKIVLLQLEKRKNILNPLVLDSEGRLVLQDLLK